MNTKQIKSAIAVCGFLAAVSAPLTSGAETSVFSGKDAFGSMEGEYGLSDMSVEAFQSATSSKSNKNSSAGAQFLGRSYHNESCWFGEGITDTIQFAAEVKRAKNVTAVTASGSVLVTWYDECGGLDPITETVTFSMNLSTITDEASFSFGTVHLEFGTIKLNDHFNYFYSPATANDSFITSPNFGSITPASGYVGQSKGHTVEITK